MQLIVLGSTSKYRAELLSRLGLSFSTASPLCDEKLLDDEPPAERAQRLACEKAKSLQAAHPQHIIIGSDQVASVNGQILRKPGNRDRAAHQLGAMSGQIVLFHTAVSVLQTSSGIEHGFTDETRVKVRSLTSNEIERYIEADNPVDCAGSFKVEQLGISLFEYVESTDPTALIGLPLIELAARFRALGLVVP